jgi:hypothetical protein
MLGYALWQQTSAEGRGAVMDHPSGPPDIPASERIEAYKILIENLERLAARRQAVNGVFVTLNTIFLTAIGVLISTHLDWLNSWSGPVALLVIAVAITPLNVAWLLTLGRYAQGNQIRYTLLEKIETRFPPEAGIGLYQQLKEEGLGAYYNTRPDRFLAAYFVFFYLVACLLAAVLAALVQQGVIPSVGLPR